MIARLVRAIRWVVHEVLASHNFAALGETRTIRVNDTLIVCDKYECSCGLRVLRNPEYGPPDNNTRYTTFSDFDTTGTRTIFEGRWP